MGDPEVKLRFAGTSADAERAIATLERRLQTLENGVKQSSKRMRDGAKEASDAWSDLVDGSQEFLGNLTGIRSPLDAAIKGVQLLQQEWDDLLVRQGRALDSNKSFAQNLETLAFNTAGDKQFDSLAKVEKLVKDISAETGVGVNDVSRALSNAASAKGQLPLQDAADAVRSTLKFAPNSPVLQDVLAGASLDVRKMYPASTAEDAIGFTAMLGQQSRITDPSKVAENALPGALLMTKVDKGSLRDNAAIYAALTQATGDVQGRTSRTGGIALAIQLEKALPDLKNTMQRVEFMQEHPEQAEQFLNGGGKFKGKGLSLDVKGPNGEDISFGTDRATFEKKVLPAIRELFSKGSSTDVNMRSALAALPEIEEGDKVYDKQMDSLRNSATIQTAKKDRALEAAAERTRIEDTHGADAAAVRKGFEENLSAEGIGSFQRGVASWHKFARERMGQSPDEAAINTAKAIADDLRHQAETTTDPRDREHLLKKAGAFSRVSEVHQLYASNPEQPLDQGANVERPIPQGRRSLDFADHNQETLTQPLDQGAKVERPTLPQEKTAIELPDKSEEELTKQAQGIVSQISNLRRSGENDKAKVAEEQLEVLKEMLNEVRSQKRRPVNRNAQREE